MVIYVRCRYSRLAFSIRSRGLCFFVGVSRLGECRDGNTTPARTWAWYPLGPPASSFFVTVYISYSPLLMLLVRTFHQFLASIAAGTGGSSSTALVTLAILRFFTRASASAARGSARKSKLL
jgi:hypothetical protein